MRSAKACIPVFTLLIVLGALIGCGNRSSANDDNGSKTDTSLKTLAKKSTTDSGEGKGSNGTDAEGRSGIAVFAFWTPKPPGDVDYDGVYDSLSGYFQMCENSQVHHIDDPREISFKPGNKCYNPVLDLKMVAIERPDAPPVFITVLHVDSVGRILVGVTASHDTISISAKTMKPEAFEQLKKVYQVRRFNEPQLNQIRRFSAPEMREQNQIRVQRVMRVQRN